MHILPETLKKLREWRRFSQQDLADRANQIKGASASKRTIVRIERSATAAKKVRPHTVESLAKALGVKPEALAKPFRDDVERDARLQEAGYHRISVHLDLPTRVNFEWVTHNYSVSVQDLINAAPWMFTLLAEMSLADRRRRLKEAVAAFDEAMAKLPSHLSHGAVARSDFECAEYDELQSLRARDIFGNKVLETDNGPDPFDPDETNPFVEYLRSTADAVGSDEIDPDDLERPYGGGMPRWPVFQAWLGKLAGADYWAGYALEHGHVRIKDIPDELKGEDHAAERAAFLAAKIPPEVRQREERSLVEIEL